MTATPGQESYLGPFGMYGRAEAVITGTVVCAAAIAAAAGHLESSGQLALAIVGTVFIYWLAHVHATALSYAVQRRADPVRAVRKSLVENMPLAFVSLIPLGILFAAEVLGIDARRAAYIALAVNIALLTFYGYIAGRRSGLSTTGRLMAAGAGAGIGMLIILLKASLH
ncbi:MAG: hypothetical protein ACOYD0_12210 [Candidatus Nanopelagicales bacterium]